MKALEDYVRRLCACGCQEAFARALCLEFMRELGPVWLEEYVEEAEHVAAFQPESV